MQNFNPNQDKQNNFTPSQILEQLKEHLADKIIEEAAADPQFAAEIEQAINESQAGETFQEPKEAEPVFAYFKSIGRSDSAPISGVTTITGYDVWDTHITLRATQILSIEMGQVVHSHYEIFDPMGWLHSQLEKFLTQKADSSIGSYTQFDEFTDMTLLQPLTNEDLAYYFIRPIYHVAPHVIDCGMDRETNPILNLFFGTAGLFHKQPVILANVLEDLKQRQSDSDSTLARYGNIILKYTFEGPAMAVAYLPVREVQKDFLN